MVDVHVEEPARPEQTADRCGFEVLFVARLDNDHRVAYVPFSDHAQIAGLARDDVILVTRHALDAIPHDRMEQMSRSAEPIDREQLADEELNRGLIG
jgi:hypothetical protein